MRIRRITLKRFALMSAALCSLCLAGVGARVYAQDKDKAGVNVTITSKDGSEAGLVIKAQASAKEAGLPLYPGSKPHKDSSGDSDANLGLWGSSFGFKLVVLKMESSDSPDKVAAFYQKALGKYATVLNCTNNVKTDGDKDEKDKKHSSGKLTCDSDTPDPGGMLFKSGTQEKQHLVGVTPAGKGCTFQLIYLEARDDSDKTPA